MIDTQSVMGKRLKHFLLGHPFEKRHGSQRSAKDNFYLAVCFL